MPGRPGNGGAVEATMATRTSRLALRTGSASAAEAASSCRAGLDGEVGTLGPERVDGEVPPAGAVDELGDGLAVLDEGTPADGVGPPRPAATGTTPAPAPLEAVGAEAGPALDEPGEESADDGLLLACGELAAPGWCSAW